MKLINYPGFFGMWPPPAHDLAGEPVQMEHCLDILVSASRISVPQHDKHFHIGILTEFKGVLQMREIIVDVEDIFARILCGFLGKQRGKTIRDIGEMDVSFLV